jgi:LAS superfamily LD-carboxypeptidase LdcB
LSVQSNLLMNELELTGRTRTHIEQLADPRVALHREVVEPFLALRAAAAKERIDLTPSSAFRDFQGQAEIWNRKFRGERPLYDRDGNPRDHASLTEEQIVEAILVWSAVPGASRHHWGSEIDVYDRAAMPEGYRVKLLPEEYVPGGVFGHLAAWLDENLHRFGFFRPYDQDRGGVYPEPWHISYAAVSNQALSALTPRIVADALRDEEILGKQWVLARLPEIWQTYVANVASATLVADAKYTTPPDEPEA